MKNCSLFLRADGKGKGLWIHHQFYAPVLCTFAAHSFHHFFEELTRFIRTGGKDKEVAFAHKEF